MHPEITVEGVRSIRAGALIAEAALRIGFMRVTGARLIEQGDRRILAMPKPQDRRAAIGIADRAVMARAVEAVERALAAIEAANGGGCDGR